MTRFYLILLSMVFVGCSADKVNDTDVLNDFLNEKELVFDNVIACAASNLNDQKVSVFFYPRTGAMNFQYFETETSLSDKNDLENYIKKAYPLKEIFNGYLMKFEIEAETEKWAIVTYEEAGKTHLSNPIRLKQISKPTEYLPENISIGTASEMPLFSWQDGVYSDTKIYFQVVSDVDDNLLSGTYTYDKMFTYYELDNVVLNITKTVPPILKTGDSYNFTLMGVSEDNWVNQFSIVDFEIR